MARASPIASVQPSAGAEFVDGGRDGAAVEEQPSAVVSRLRTDAAAAILAAVQRELAAHSAGDGEPFTEYTASELGTDPRANLPAVAVGGSYQVLTDDQTGGWLDITPYIDDLLSSAARPEAKSDYTHKLETGVTATAGPFAHLSPHSWLHGVRVAGTLDWVVTGLPREGDEIPKGERVFLDDAKGYSASVGVTLPVAPLP